MPQSTPQPPLAQQGPMSAQQPPLAQQSPLAQQGPMSAQQVPRGPSPVPMAPPARLDITPEGDNVIITQRRAREFQSFWESTALCIGDKSASRAYGAVIASSIPEEFVREVKCPQSVIGRVSREA